MSTSNRRMVSIGLGVMVLAAVIWVNAGSLTPPVGPVAPTMKTLSEIEPRTAVQSLSGDGSALYVISQAGSYYLTGNITGVAGKNGIRIDADNVTLDLAGFALTGVGGSNEGVVAGEIQNPRHNLAVFGGMLLNWPGGSGLDANFAHNGRFERLQASGNGGAGIAVTGGQGCIIVNCVGNENGTGILAGGSTVKDCAAYSNIADGINAGSGSVVNGCSVGSNGGRGIFAFSDCTVIGCTAESNTGDGISLGPNSTLKNCIAAYSGGNGVLASSSTTLIGCTTNNNTINGISASDASTILSCTANGNSNNGILATSSCTIKDATARSNGIAGIATGDGCTLSGCTAASNHAGIILGTGCTATGCTAQLNVAQGNNAGDGIYSNSGRCTFTGCTSYSNAGVGVGGQHSTITGCTATKNQNFGIYGYNSATISGCTSNENHNHGIWAGGSCLVVGNNCESNNSGDRTLAGIYAQYSDSRIEGNHVASNDYGVKADGTNNLIIRNSARGNNNTNYNIAPGNRDAQRLTGGTNFVSTDPWANFAY